jgi:predicted RNA-binding protein with PIN domain
MSEASVYEDKPEFENAMNDRWILVDGYSVLHAWPKLRRLARRRLEQQREVLVTALRQYADHTGRKVTVVFDGYAAKHKPEVAGPSHGVEVLFSERGKTADDVIERLVGQAEARKKILVVTSDNMERHTVESMGAQSVSAEAFEVEVETALAELGRLVRFHGRRRKIGSVRDRFGG